MNNENNSYTIKKAVMFFLYNFVGAFTTMLSLFHFTTTFIQKALADEIMMAVMCGIAMAAVNTYVRIKSGRMGEPIVHMRKFGYWAFTELALFYFFIMQGVIHLFDYEGSYMMHEIIFGVFFALFCAGVNVLYLIKREKRSRN